MDRVSEIKLMDVSITTSIIHYVRRSVNSLVQSLIAFPRE